LRRRLHDDAGVGRHDRADGRLIGPQIGGFRDVALKIVRRDRAYDPETKARFEREARAMSSLTSPHTVTVFDFGEADDGSWFLAMEMLVGETLGERLRREGALPWRTAARITCEALKSLSEAHKKGIIHRDLKPDNLLLMRRVARSESETDDMCKVLDFGIAKLQHDDQKLDQLETQAGTVFGTPRYMSPEQAQGAELDARSDLYSLGVILFQMLSGRAPFVDGDAVVVMAKHIKDAPPSFDAVAPEAGVPRPLQRVVERALAKKPGERIQSAEHFISDLQQAVAEVTSSSRQASVATTTAALEPVARPSPPQLRSQGRVMLAALGALGLLLVGGFLTGLFWWVPTTARSAADVDENLTLRVPARMPPPSVEANPGASAPAEPAVLPAGSAAPEGENSLAPGERRDSVGQPTRERRRHHGPSGSVAAPSAAPKTMEPKRPDERYGRFR